MESLKCDFLGYPLYRGSLDRIDFNKVRIINTINPHSYYCTRDDTEFRKALKEGDLLLPDGVGIVLGAKLLGIKLDKRISGSDIHLSILHMLDQREGKVFYLGSSEPTLQKLQEHLGRDFPNVSMSWFSPPFKEEFSQADSSLMIEKVNAFAPDILFVGMTAPRQEKWVYRNQDRINAGHIASIGAVFDYYAGTIKRPSEFWIKLGLEWFVRMLGEPRRLWKRTFVSAPYFLWHVIKQRISHHSYQ